MEILENNEIETKIYTIRNTKVMIDHDLAKLYEVETKVLNQAVKRNLNRFPSDFMFQLTPIEENSLRSQFVTLDNDSKSLRGKHKKYNSYVFSEHGILMLSSVLKSKLAVEINIKIMRTFSKMREFAIEYNDISKKLNEIEKTMKIDQQQLNYNTSRIDDAFKLLNQILKDTQNTDKNLIGFRPK
jgi:hypothetical protein